VRRLANGSADLQSPRAHEADIAEADNEIDPSIATISPENALRDGSGDDSGLGSEALLDLPSSRSARSRNTVTSMGAL
jgi:hypothetical protein